MRVSSIVLSVLAISGLLPFGKLDAAVLAIEQQAAIGESLCESSEREQRVEFEAIVIDRESDVYSSQTLPKAVFCSPRMPQSYRLGCLQQPQQPLASESVTKRNVDFGSLAINAP